MSKVNLVLGANGHLGNNLLRTLQQKEENVRASVRNPLNTKPFKGLNCEVVGADLVNKESLIRIMENVDVLYVAAGVYRSWAKDIQKEIVEVNMTGTRNLMEAAAARKVGKVVFVSTAHALDLRQSPLNETTWNSDYADPYRYSKTEGEKLAWKLAEEYDLPMVSVLPTGMVGPNCFGPLTPTMEALAGILGNKIPVNPGFNMNFVDVRDVADAMIAAAENGRAGERYLLGQEKQMTMSELLDYACELYPGIKIPSEPPCFMLYTMVTLMEVISWILKKQPAMQRFQLRTMRSSMDCNTLKARRDLGFKPRLAKEALKDAFAFLMGAVTFREGGRGR